MTNRLLTHVSVLRLASLLALATSFGVGPRVLAQAEVPPAIALSTGQPAYEVGDAIVLTVSATNTSDTAWDYGPIHPQVGYFTFEVVDPEGALVPMYPLQAGQGRPFVVSNLTAVPPGGVLVGSVLLSHYWDILAPGTYTVRVGYPEVEQIPVGNGGAYRLSVTGHTVATTSFTVAVPAGVEALTASYVSAVRAVMAGVSDETLEDELTSLASEPAFAEGATFYRLVYRDVAGATEQAGNTAWHATTATLAEAFITTWSSSVYLPEAVRIRAAARAQVTPPPPGGPNPSVVGVEALCGGDAYRAVNGNSAEVTLSLSDPSGGTATLQVPPLSSALFRFESAGEPILVEIDGELYAALHPTPTTCNEAVLDALDPPDPYASLTGAVVVAESAEASFSGSAFSISGAPTGLDGTSDADAEPVHGIATLDAASASAILAALSGNQTNRVTGLGAPPDVAVAEVPFDPEAWVAELAAQAAELLAPRPRGPVGTVDDPIVAYAPSGVRLTGGFRGVGVLVVDGAFEMRGNAEWIGLLVVRGSLNQAAAADLSGNSGIIGGLVVLPGVGESTSLSLAGRASVRYSPEALGVAKAATDGQP